MQMVCMDVNDVETTKNIVLDYLGEVADYIDSGIPIHQDWRRDVDSVLQQYGSIVLGLEELERRVEEGSLNICWFEGTFGR